MKQEGTFLGQTHHPPLSPLSPQGSYDTMSVVSTSSVNSSSSKSHLIDVPTHWHAETQHCLDTKAVSDEARNDIIRTLVTLLIGKYGSKPSRRQCEQASRALILQYPFLKDDLGPGYVSLNCYIYMHASSIFGVCVHGTA